MTIVIVDKPEDPSSPGGGGGVVRDTEGRDKVATLVTFANAPPLAARSLLLKPSFVARTRKRRSTLEPVSAAAYVATLTTNAKTAAAVWFKARRVTLLMRISSFVHRDFPLALQTAPIPSEITFMKLSRAF